jgi:hypothetical protein
VSCKSEYQTPLSPPPTRSKLWSRKMPLKLSNPASRKQAAEYIKRSDYLGLSHYRPSCPTTSSSNCYPSCPSISSYPTASRQDQLRPTTSGCQASQQRSCTYTIRPSSGPNSEYSMTTSKYFMTRSEYSATSKYRQPVKLLSNHGSVVSTRMRAKELKRCLSSSYPKSFQA